jgi:hypothetical protein
MDQHRRVLFLTITAGFHPAESRFHEIATRLYYLDVHFPENKLNAALQWLIANKLTGARFVEWAKGDCAGSNLEMHRLLLSRIEKETKTKLFFEKDFKQ